MPLIVHSAFSRDSLTPGEIHYYKYGDYYAWSPEYSFRASPSAGADVTTTVITYGGMYDIQLMVHGLLESCTNMNNVSKFVLFGIYPTHAHRHGVWSG